MSVDGVDKTGLLTIPDTGAWTTFQTITKSGVSLTAGQHVLRVTIDSIGTNNSAAGNINWFNFVLTSSSSVPTAPSSLTATAISSSQVNLAWADNSSNETGFEIDRSTSSTFASGVSTVTLSANVKSYVVTGLTSNTTYYFRVRSTNANGDSTNSNSASAATLSTTTTPATPSNLSATAGTASQISLTWTDNSSNETGFEIDRSTSSTFASGVITATVAANVTGYSATGLSANTTYYFRVRSTNGSGDSSNSGTASARTSPPSAPSGLNATTASSSQITLTWTDNANDETGFAIDRSTNSSFTANLATNAVSRNVTSYVASGLAASTTYYFRVRATNAVGASANSAADNATTSAGPATPAAPTGLAAAVASTTQVNLDWSDAAGAGITYNVYRGTTSSFTIGVGNRIASALSSSRYANSGIPSAGTYYYKITAVAGGVESAAATTTAQNATVTPPLPQAITSLHAAWDAAANGGLGAVVLTWNDNSLGETGFVFTRTDVDGTTHTLTAPTNATQLVDPGPFPAAPPFSPPAAPPVGPIYTGQAQNGAGTSPASNPATGPVPTGSGLLDDAAWRDNIADNNGGMDDGDGNQPLTERDGFWNGFSGDTIFIGFSGHTQSMGFDEVKGRIWNIPETTGAYQIGMRLKNDGYKVTMFPEDPGNKEAIELGSDEGLQLCGDGVLGSENPNLDGARKNAQGAEGTGALAFIYSAIMTHNVKKIGLFGYSHGGGSVSLLVETIAKVAQNDGDFRNKLILPLQAGGPVKIFGTAYIDAVNIILTGNGIDTFNGTGSPQSETQFPIFVAGNNGETVGTMRHFGIYQDWSALDQDDNVPLDGEELDEDNWTNFGKAPGNLNQINTDGGGVDVAATNEHPDLDWGPRGLDHTDKAKVNGVPDPHGIAENDVAGNINYGVQSLVVADLKRALDIVNGN